jgi:hypothetical protein
MFIVVHHAFKSAHIRVDDEAACEQSSISGVGTCGEGINMIIIYIFYFQMYKKINMRRNWLSQGKNKFTRNVLNKYLKDE